jgi:hypothetical protein
VSIVLPPEAIVVSGEIVGIGKGLTVTVMALVLVQLKAFVPETVYVVVDVGVAVTEAPVVDDKPVAGDQV